MLTGKLAVCRFRTRRHIRASRLALHSVPVFFQLSQIAAYMMPGVSPIPAAGAPVLRGHAGSREATPCPPTRHLSANPDPKRSRREPPNALLEARLRKDRQQGTTIRAAPLPSPSPSAAPRWMRAWLCFHQRSKSAFCQAILRKGYFLKS